MSYVPKDLLKGILDPRISFYTSDQSFTTSVVNIDLKTQFQAYAKTFRIVNQDSVNNLSYRQGSVSGISKIVPPNSEVVVNGWESFIQITPNAGTGAGFIEFDLVNVPDAYKQ